MAHPASSSLADRISNIAAGTPTETVAATSRLLETVQHSPSRNDSVARIVDAVTALTEESSGRALDRIARADSDFDVLYNLIAQPEFLSRLAERDPLAPARVRALQMRERLIAAEGGALTAEQAASLYGITRQAIDNRRKRGSLLAVQLGRRGYRYPAWQFTETGVLAGLDRVLAALETSSPWTRIAFMLNANAWLDGRRPLDLLRAGEIDAVIRAADRFGEQSAA
jgi:hypothetical protein